MLHLLLTAGLDLQWTLGEILLPICFHVVNTFSVWGHVFAHLLKVLQVTRAPLHVVKVPAAVREEVVIPDGLGEVVKGTAVTAGFYK